MPNLNDIRSALMDMYDLRRAIPKNIQKKPKDNDGTDTTVGDCINSVIELLEDLVIEREKNGL